MVIIYIVLTLDISIHVIQFNSVFFINLIIYICHFHKFNPIISRREQHNSGLSRRQHGKWRDWVSLMLFYWQMQQYMDSYNIHITMSHVWQLAI